MSVYAIGPRTQRLVHLQLSDCLKRPHVTTINLFRTDFSINPPVISLARLQFQRLQVEHVPFIFHGTFIQTRILGRFLDAFEAHSEVHMMRVCAVRVQPHDRISAAGPNRGAAVRGDRSACLVQLPARYPIFCLFRVVPVRAHFELVVLWIACWTEVEVVSIYQFSTDFANDIALNRISRQLADLFLMYHPVCYACGVV